MNLKQLARLSSLVSILAVSQLVQAEYCNLIDVGTSQDNPNIIRGGVLQKEFDQRITTKDNLFYLPFEKMSQVIYVNTPVALTRQPVVRGSEREVNTNTEMDQMPSNDANKLLLEIKQDYSCPMDDNFFGVTYFNMTLSFEGCPTYTLTWQKSCGKDTIPAMHSLIIKEANSLLDRPVLFADGQLIKDREVIPATMDQMYLKIQTANHKYEIEPPYVRNLNQASTLMYPVLKGNAAWGGEISNSVVKHLLIEFNCLGIKGTEDVTVMIPAKHYQPVEMTFRKQCPNKSIFSVIEEDLSQSRLFDLLFFIFIILVTLNVLYCCVVFAKIRNSTNLSRSLQQLPIVGFAQRIYFNASQISSKMQKDARDLWAEVQRSQLVKPKRKQDAFTNAFGEEVQIEIPGQFDLNSKKGDTPHAQEESEEKCTGSKESPESYGGL